MFPELVEPVASVGVVGRARERGLIEVIHASPRDFASDRHRTVDDRPYGGGPGMVLRYTPLRDAIRSLQARLPAQCPVVVLSAQGRRFDQAYARELAAGPGLLLVAGRYEGIDERIVTGLQAEEVALGDYVMSGGELAAAVMIDTIVRLLPGTLGHEESAVEDSYTDGLLDEVCSVVVGIVPVTRGLVAATRCEGHACRRRIGLALDRTAGVVLLGCRRRVAPFEHGGR